MNRRSVDRRTPIRRLLAVGALALALAACSSGPRDLRGRNLPAAANPSAVIAAELAFARAAQENGQWTAFAEYAADDAVMFVPERVNARDWLRKQQNPPRAVAWQPHQVWSSCDGSLAATKGAWQRPDGSRGYFTTVWRRKQDGSYEWVMDQGDTLTEPLPAPEMIGAAIADCAAPPAEGEALPSGSGGKSRDGTLRWAASVEDDLSREISVTYWDGSAWRNAIHERVAAP